VAPGPDRQHGAGAAGAAGACAGRVAARGEAQGQDRRRLGITRQSLIKVWLAERLERVA
jgi:hypothetical protein